MPWPTNWAALTTADDCPMCKEGRPGRTQHGVRIFEGVFVDGYVATQAAQRGYVVAIWRGSHVNDLTELTPDELFGYWSEVGRISSAMQQHFRPRKMNYEVLGNQVPHLHTHITARFADVDVAPGQPLPAARERAIPESEVEADTTALVALLRSDDTN
jgi:diadenosine tetraphosphate (Ap4A) HIT family hydrolase